jgi:hypothetical protein
MFCKGKESRRFLFDTLTYLPQCQPICLCFVNTTLFLGFQAVNPTHCGGFICQSQCYNSYSLQSLINPAFQQLRPVAQAPHCLTWFLSLLTLLSCLPGFLPHERENTNLMENKVCQ